MAIDNNTAQSLYDDLPSDVQSKIGNVNDLKEGLNGSGTDKATVLNALSQGGVTNPTDPPVKGFNRNDFVKKEYKKSDKARVIDNLKKADVKTQPSTRKSVTQRRDELRLKQFMSDLKRSQVKNDNIKKTDTVQRNVEKSEFKRASEKPKESLQVEQMEVEQFPAFVKQVNEDQLFNEYVQNGIREDINDKVNVNDISVEKGESFYESSNIEARKYLYNGGIINPTIDQIEEAKNVLTNGRRENYAKELDNYIFQKEGLFEKINALSNKVNQDWITANEKALPEQTSEEVFKGQLNSAPKDVLKGNMFKEGFENPNSGLVQMKDISGIDQDDFAKFLWDSGLEERYSKSLNTLRTQDDQANILFKYRDWRSQKENHNYLLNFAKEQRAMHNGDEEEALKYNRLKLNSFNKIEKDIVTFATETLPSLAEYNIKTNRNKQEHAEYMYSLDRIKKGDFSFKDVTNVSTMTFNESSANLVKLTTGLSSSVSQLVGDVGGSVLNAIGGLTGDYESERAWRGLFGGTSDYIHNYVNEQFLTPDMYNKKAYDSETKLIKHNGKEYQLRSDGLVYDKSMILVDDEQSREILKNGEMRDGESKYDPFKLVSDVVTQVALMRKAGQLGQITNKAGLGLVGQDMTYVLSSYKDNRNTIDEAFPNISDNEKTIYAGTLSTIDSMWERINPDLKYFKEVNPSKLIVATIRNQGKGITQRNIIHTFENQIVKPIAKELVEEYGVLGTTSLFNNLTNTIYGADRLSAEITQDDIVNTGVITAVTSLVLGGRQTAQSYRIGNMNYENALIYATRNTETNKLLKEMIADPKLAETYGAERVQSLKEIVHDLETQTSHLPNDISIEGTKRSLPLIEEKARLNREKENTDKLYHANINKKIEIIDEALYKVYEEDLANTNKIVNEKAEMVQEDGQGQRGQEIEGRNEESQGRETEIRETEKTENRQALEELTSKLQETGLAETAQIVNQETFDNKLKEIGKYDESQDVKGFVHEGEVYINEDKASMDTPVHEFSHLWNEYNKESNPELHNEGKTLISNEGQVYIDQVKQNDPTLEGDNLLDEALSRAIGDNGALLQPEQKNVFKEWLSKMWNGITSKLGITNITPEQAQTIKLRDFIDNARKDLLKGETISSKPVKVTDTKFSRKKKPTRSDKMDTKKKDPISPEVRKQMKINGENRKKGRDQIKEARQEAVDTINKNIKNLTKGNEFTPREVTQITNTINKYNKKGDKSKQQIDNRIKQIVSATRKRKAVKLVKTNKAKLRKRLASPNQIKGKYADQVKDLLRVNTGAFTTNQLNDYNNAINEIAEHYKAYSDSSRNKNITFPFEGDYKGGKNVFDHFKEIERIANRKKFRDGMKKATLKDLDFTNEEIDLLNTPNKNLNNSQLEEKELLKEIEKERRAEHEDTVNKISDEEIDILYDESIYESSEEQLEKRRKLAEKHRGSIIEYAKRVQSRLNPNDPKVKELIGLDIDIMSNDDIIGFNKAVENYLNNDDTTRIEFYNKIAEGQKASVEINAYLRSNFKRHQDNLHRTNEAKEVNAVLKKGRDLFKKSLTMSNFLYNMMGSNTKASWMYNKLGLQELSQAHTKSIHNTKKFNEGFEQAMKDARKINNRNVDLRDRTENIRRAVLANLLQVEQVNPELEPEHMRARVNKDNEFKFREHIKRYIDVTIDSYKNIGDTRNTSDSDQGVINILEGIKDEIKNVKNKADLIEYLKTNDKGNYKLLEYVRDQYADISEEFAAVSAEIHNLQPKMYTLDDFYLPLRRINLDNSHFSTNKELIERGSSNIQSINNEPVNALDRMKNAKLRTGEAIDLDFDTGMTETYGKQQYDINSSPVVKKVSTILSNHEMAKLLGEDMTYLKERVAFKVLGDRGDLKYNSSELSKLLAPVEKWFRSQMAYQALGGLDQMLRQFPPVVLSAYVRQSMFDTKANNPLTFANALVENGKVFAKVLQYSPKDVPLLTQSSILLRDDKDMQHKQVSDVKETGRMKGYNKSKSRKRFERAVGNENSILNTMNEAMMWSLRKGDVKAANASFLMYYTAKLREDGIHVTDYKTEHLKLDDSPEGKKRKEALAYAQHLVNSTQMSSDMTEGHMLLLGEGVPAKFLSNALFSFQRMANNSKSRFYVALTKTKGGTKADRKEAYIELSSTLTEMMVFQGIKQFLLAPVYLTAVNLLSNTMFRDDDEKKSAFNEYMDNLYKYSQKFYSSVIADVSPVSEGITANIGNRILYGIDKISGNTKAGTVKAYIDEVNEKNKKHKETGNTDLVMYSFDKQPDEWDWIGGYKLPIDNAVLAYDAWDAFYSKTLSEDSKYGVNHYDFEDANPIGLAIHAIMNTLAMAGAMDVGAIRQERKIFNEYKKKNKITKSEYELGGKKAINKLLKETSNDSNYDSDVLEEGSLSSDTLEEGTLE